MSTAGSEATEERSRVGRMWLWAGLKGDASPEALLPVARESEALALFSAKVDDASTAASEVSEERSEAPESRTRGLSKQLLTQRHRKRTRGISRNQKRRQ